MEATPVTNLVNMQHLSPFSERVYRVYTVSFSVSS
jgi:hypothetical protein